MTTNQPPKKTSDSRAMVFTSLMFVSVFVICLLLDKNLTQPTSVTFDQEIIARILRTSATLETPTMERLILRSGILASLIGLLIYLLLGRGIGDLLRRPDGERRL